MWVAGNTICDTSFIRTIPACLRDELLMIKRYTSLRLLPINYLSLAHTARVHGPCPRVSKMHDATCMFTGRKHGCYFDNRVHGPCPWTVDTGVILDTRRHG